jgi:hypothetical protein
MKRADTVVLGLGMATVTATNGNAVLTTADVPGSGIAGVTVDTGPVNSPVLVQIGSRNGDNGAPHNLASHPAALLHERRPPTSRRREPQLRCQRLPAGGQGPGESGAAGLLDRLLRAGRRSLPGPLMRG